ncbi:MAG: hypothetical protein IT221_03140 [Fluviicola sp.]|nr:hypothetical protein [Fluviicola sp.]
MSKIGKIVVLILLPFCSVSQGAVIGMPELFVLYSGYYNVIEIANNGVSDSITLISDDVTFTEKDSFQYVANVSSHAKSTFIYTINTRTSDTLDKAFFRIRNLPPPDIYLCNVKNGDTVILQKNMHLSGHYDEDIFLEFSTRFFTTTIKINNQSFEFDGNVFPKKVVNFIETAIQNSSTRSVDISLLSTVIGTGGCPRKKSAHFTIRK